MRQMYRLFHTLLEDCNTYLMTRATMLFAAPRNRSSDRFPLCDATSLNEV